MNTLKDFKDYILRRHKCYEYKMGLTDQKSYLYSCELPNNLKYMDDMSQTMIRTLNHSQASLRDKVLTAFVYRFVGNEALVRKYCKNMDAITPEYLVKLGDKLNSLKEIDVNYNSPAVLAHKYYMESGDFLMASCEDFLDKLPVGFFKTQRLSQVFKYLTKKKVFGMDPYMCFLLATDLSYIDDLKLKIDLVPYETHIYRKYYEEFTGEHYTTQGFRDFVVDMCKWYSSQDFFIKEELLVTPNDILHMLKAFKVSEGRPALRVVRRNEKRFFYPRE